MNNKAKILIKNFSFTLTSNIIAIAISTLVTLVVPKLIGVEEYGYWQLYLFYSSYIGFLQFGWNDGIYLRYGGFEYNKLDKKTLFLTVLDVVFFPSDISKYNSCIINGFYR